ncbi:uncharacterized protein LOC143912402 [Arctopsyche grandis]|uniref:uncharacterized protein LOC143912402 n=1 Tax=Arctopsyche grandis TaxID=121162 RepID=UPI00406D9E79
MFDARFPSWAEWAAWSAARWAAASVTATTAITPHTGHLVGGTASHSQRDAFGESSGSYIAVSATQLLTGQLFVARRQNTVGGSRAGYGNFVITTGESSAPKVLRSLFTTSITVHTCLVTAYLNVIFSACLCSVISTLAIVVLEHYENPRNVGSLDKKKKNVGTGLVGAPACGDVMKLQIEVDDQGKIIDAKFKTFGCGSAIASSSLATVWVKGKTVDQALKLKNTDIAKELSLPPVKLHCSMLAEDAIKAALSEYRIKQQMKDE